MAPIESGSTVDLTVVVCTRDRPDELRDCLASLVADRRLAAVLVSDDSALADSPGANRSAVETARREGGPDVTYADGPRQGLAANRNSAIRAVRTSYTAFLDDDARWNPAFLDAARPALADDTIVTGYELRGQLRVDPRDADFLGFQHVVPGPDLHSIVVNATIFPTALLRQLGFDPFYAFGCEEIDIAVRARQLGASIRAVDEGVVHLHVPSSRAGNDIAAAASRVYFCLRRYLHVEKRRALVLPYLLVGPAHAVLRTPLPSWRDRWTLARRVLRAVTAALRTSRLEGLGSPERLG